MPVVSKPVEPIKNKPVAVTTVSEKTAVKKCSCSKT